MNDMTETDFGDVPKSCRVCIHYSDKILVFLCDHQLAISTVFFVHSETLLPYATPSGALSQQPRQ